MQTSGGTELGYASAAILTELLKHLVEIHVITPQAAVDILANAAISLEGLGNRVGVRGALGVIAEVRSDLAK